jgi:hypothetical protein
MARSCGVDLFDRWVGDFGWFIFKICLHLSIQNAILIATIAAITFRGGSAFTRSFIAYQPLKIGSIVNIAQYVIIGSFHSNFSADAWHEVEDESTTCC